MSCMEHTCHKCGHMEFNNSSTPQRCKKCGGEDFLSVFDEANDHYHEPAYWADEDEEGEHDEQ